MLLIHEFVDSLTDPKRFKAPKDKVYFIESVMLSIRTPGNNIFHMLDRDVDGSSFTGDSNINAILSMDLQSRLALAIGSINHKTKYITLGLQNSTSSGLFVSIFGQILGETQANLIWEYLSKVSDSI